MIFKILLKLNIFPFSGLTTKGKEFHQILKQETIKWKTITLNLTDQTDTLQFKQMPLFVVFVHRFKSKMFTIKAFIICTFMKKTKFEYQ